MIKKNKLSRAVLAIFLFFSGILYSPTTTALAWGDNGGGRESYTLDQINSGILGDKIVFNSISNSTIGDEKNFVGAREYTGINAGVDNVWNGNEITVQNGKEYLVRLYVHNNNPNGLDAVSHNTRVAFDVPESTVSAKKLQVNGFIFSDNATPSEYWDYIDFVSDHSFHLEYIYGSAFIENNGYASQINGGAKQLSDSIVTKAASENGVAISYERGGNGEIPGCYTYACYVTIRVKVVFDYEFTTETKVRHEGETEWHDVIDASIGDSLEFLVHYENTSEEAQENVVFYNMMPKQLRYKEGSAILKTAGSLRNLDENNLYGKNANIGDFPAGTSADITFAAEIAKMDSEDQLNTLVNWTQISVGATSQQGYSSIKLLEANRILLIISDIIIIACLLIIPWFLYILFKRKQH